LTLKIKTRPDKNYKKIEADFAKPWIGTFATGFTLSSQN
jgi:hypothetical protein